MKKIMEYLRGKKTYITAIVIGITAGLGHLGIEVPDYVFEFLAGIGLITLRAGIEKNGK